MDMTVLENAYKDIKTSLPMVGIILLISFIAILLITDRFVTEYRKATREEGINAKAFFELFWIYILAYAVIVCLPFIVSGIEKPLSLFQEQVISNYSSYLAMNVNEAMEYYEKQYVENEGGFTGVELIPVVRQLYNIYTAITETVYLALLYISKYLFYLYSSGRYLYLLLLEIVAPLAIVLMLNKDTKQHFYTWLKYLIICYMMIPTFLLANTFAELVAQHLFPGGSASLWDINYLGPVGLFLTVAFKFYLFAFGQRQLFNLL